MPFNLSLISASPLMPRREALLFRYQASEPAPEGSSMLSRVTFILPYSVGPSAWATSGIAAAAPIASASSFLFIRTSPERSSVWVSRAVGQQTALAVPGGSIDRACDRGVLRICHLRDGRAANQQHARYAGQSSGRRSGQ